MKQYSTNPSLLVTQSNQLRAGTAASTVIIQDFRCGHDIMKCWIFLIARFKIYMF